MRKLTTLTVGALLMCTNVSTTEAYQPRALYGEYQEIPNINPPTRLDIALVTRSWSSNTKRCDHMGGTLVKEKFKGRTIHVCQEVDY